MLEKEGIAYKDIEKAIDSLEFKSITLIPRACVVGIDTTYFSKRFGVTIFRDVTNGKTLYWNFVVKENINPYVRGIEYLERSGITILGFVVDGFWGFFVRYGNKYSIQMCQKHMKDIVRRYITNKPKLQASKELKEILKPLINLSEATFNNQFDNWLVKWREFLKEKTYNEENHKWVYTHDKLRKAVGSLIRYRHYLFTYEKNNWIPNTNNSIEGFNSSLKSFIGLHRGLRGDRKAKLIHEYLRMDSKFNWGDK